MSLTISVTLGGEARTYDESKSVNFDSGDGFWEYLGPWINQFNERCSEFIDLYEVYNLKSQSLPMLVELLTTALTTARESPDSIKVFVGTLHQMGKTIELHTTIDRVKLVALIEKMIFITNEAIKSGETLANLGD